MNAKAPPVANKKTPKIMVEVFIAPYRHRRKRDRSVRLLEQSLVFSEVLRLPQPAIINRLNPAEG